MRAWRLCRAPFADLSGDGARLYGGRWNSPGRPLVYAASTAALAVLEVRDHESDIGIRHDEAINEVIMQNMRASD